MMVKVADFLDGVEAIVRTNPVYELGQDGRAGSCDCIGLVIGGIRRAGGVWKGTHGSNWAARNATAMLRPIDRSSLGLGEIVYKARKPGSAGYNLPDEYKNHSDQNDYYHVGIVTGVSPLRVTHCTKWSGGNGIKMDNIETTAGGWTHEGRVDAVDYSEESSSPATTMRVMTGNGGPLNMRDRPSINGARTAQIPNGALVDVAGTEGEWSRVSWDGKEGYAMSSFLKPVVSEIATTARELAQRVYELIKGHL